MSKIVIESGDVFNKLTVVREVDKHLLPSGGKMRRFLCVCDCGKETTVLLSHLIRGKIKSCGCYQKTKNGESGSLLHKRYKAMIERCYPDAIDSHRYYDRGIGVCDEWINSYESFKEWALSNGFDKNLQIDRINNNKGYSPDNCRFVEPEVNVNNRDVTFYLNYNGEQIPFMTLMKKIGIKEVNYDAIRGRISRGWNHQKAVDTPIKNGNYRRNH